MAVEQRRKDFAFTLLFFSSRRVACPRVIFAIRITADTNTMFFSSGDQIRRLRR